MCVEIRGGLHAEVHGPACGLGGVGAEKGSCTGGVADGGEVGVGIVAINYDLAGNLGGILGACGRGGADDAHSLDKLGVFAGGGAEVGSFANEQAAGAVYPSCAGGSDAVRASAVDIDAGRGGGIIIGNGPMANNGRVGDVQRGVLAPVINGGKAVNAGLNGGHRGAFVLGWVEGVIGNGGAVAVDILDLARLNHDSHCVQALRGRGTVANALKEEDQGAVRAAA